MIFFYHIILFWSKCQYFILMQDISLGVALGSASQISMFVVRMKIKVKQGTFIKLNSSKFHTKT